MLDPAEYLVDLLDADVRVEVVQGLLLPQSRIGALDAHLTALATTCHRRAIDALLRWAR